MALTDKVCRNAKAKEKPYKITDSAGLYLYVAANGTRLWRLDYAFEGKRRTASIGHYPDISLVEARAEREKIKTAIREGRDPAKTVVDPDALTFRQVTEEWFKANIYRWAPSYSTRFWNRLENDVLASIGGTGIKAVTAPQLLAELRKIEERGAVYTAKRVREIVAKIFQFAIASGYTNFNPADSLGVALKPLPPEKHRSALKESQLTEFFAALRTYEGEETTVLGLKLVAHVFLRTDELRFGKWSEIEGDAWIIPAERMKMKKEHVVPLSRQVQTILARLKDLAGDSEWLLPGVHPSRPISANTLIYGMYRAGFRSRASVHGFRSTFSTIANDSALWRPDVIERQLAHVPKNEVRSAYNRALYINERRSMMTWYSDLLEKYEKAAADKVRLLDGLL